MKKPSGKRQPFITWMLLAVPAIAILSVPLHFLYEWTNQSVLAGIFAPVNESVWEHLKLTFWPILVWWGIGNYLYGDSKAGTPRKIAVTCAAAEIVCMAVIVGFYYTYTGAFGIESFILNIAALLVGLIAAVLLARHIYIHAKPGRLASAFSVVIILIIAFLLIYFTASPPLLPIFQDS